MLSYDQMTVLLALLGLIALGGTLLVVADRLGAADPDGRFGVVSALAPWGLWIAFVVALTATAGSLYLSEVAHLPPCRLCWFQRIAIYPLVPLLGLAAWRGDRPIAPYVWSLNALGSAVSVWHVLVERYPTLESGACDPLNPCSIVWFRHVGFLTIPALALIAQITVATFVAVARVDTGRSDAASVRTRADDSSFADLPELIT